MRSLPRRFYLPPGPWNKVAYPTLRMNAIAAFIRSRVESAVHNQITPIRTEADLAEGKSFPASPIAVRTPQMAEMLGIGLTKANELVKTGAVESRLLGRTRIISVRSIRALIGEAA